PFCKDVDSVRSDSDGENESFVVDDAEFETDQKEVGRVCKVIDETFAVDRNMEAVLDECGVKLSHGLFETMVSVLEEMGSKDLLTVETFSICIKAFAAAKERKKAVGMFDLMKKVKNLMEAGRTWNSMIDNGFKPDIIAHNTMLEGLLRSKKRSDAIKLFEVMKSKGPLPNVRSYAILIKYLCKQGNLKEAVEYLDDMLTRGYEPDAAVYTCLMTGFGNQKKMDMVHRLLNEMKEKGCPPDGRMYNALIKMMANRHLPDDATGKFQWACKYLEEMIDKGMKAPQLDYNKFTADFCRAGRANILEDLAQKMKFSGNSDVADLLERWMR
ncbi:UNVERIFIED_CONTAM: Pentatricopeptide repeat-containing protein, mitochondrial, partial [Sesamum angustifolium]